ncbi:MAG TPA: DUF72 domain-containing protein [Candidatus Binatia bacterium]|jgi:uncharacterized protein YecE (DUF72 family)
MAGRIFIGTSGWNYKHWMNGRFYPRACPQSEWLEFYARHFPTVEINNSFYRLPAPETFAAWARKVPADFLFAVKASRFITHIRRLKEPKESVKLLLSRSSRLGKKLGPILFQLPPQMKVDLGRLEGLIHAFSRRRALKVALEFRHESWFTQEIYDVVAKAGWTVCLADWLDAGREIPVVGSFCYIRRHGKTARYASCYSHAQLKEDARLATKQARTGRDVFVYFNNDAEAYAIKNARTLIGMIEPKYRAGAGKKKLAGGR